MFTCSKELKDSRFDTIECNLHQEVTLQETISVTGVKRMAR